MLLQPSFEHWISGLQNLSPRVSDYTEHLQTLKSELQFAFADQVDIKTLVDFNTAAMDALLDKIWVDHGLGSDTGTLIAAGGYGRGELHPYSDIDILILVPEQLQEAYVNKIRSLVTFFWDLGLDLGHSVRTVEECKTESVADLTVITNLMESRFLSGNQSLYDELLNTLSPDNIWPGDEFFSAKLEEQQNRHQRFGETAYKLEPNLKESPGGLRDLHMLGWVTKRYFRINNLTELLEKGFLTDKECDQLNNSRDFLWKVRFALHLIAKRKEDRLLFDYQYDLAKAMGFDQPTRNDAIESFMQTYYRTVMQIERLQEMLLQYFDEAILHPDDTLEILRINKRFHLHQGYIEASGEHVFKRYPFALLEIFLLIQQDPEIKGVMAQTVRLIRDHLYLIDDDFRQDISNRSLFMEIVRQPEGITHAFRRMNVYGVLGAYLPAFDAIVGRMQFDLFHIYTVDEHTLRVLRNARRLGIEKHFHELPECSEIFLTLPKPELLYLAALFHDIAKGRDGDHSKLGEVDAREFCINHGLSQFDTKLVAWLVSKHLVMSVTAQRKDIADPAVIEEFAEMVETTSRLKYLYLLTVSDIMGTNPEMWNDWKGSLLSQLYRSTYTWLTRKESTEDIHDSWVDEIKAEALKIIARDNPELKQPKDAWSDLHEEYFLRFSPDEIAWHSSIIDNSRNHPDKVIYIRPDSQRGATEILIYAPVHSKFFSLATHGLEQLGLNILDARIYTTRSGMAIDSFLVHENDGMPCLDQFRIEEISERLEGLINNPDADVKTLDYPLPRRHRNFETPTRVIFRHDEERQITELTIKAADRRGLLADIAQAIYQTRTRIKMAKISTIGEEAHDVLHITNYNHQPLDKNEQKLLKKTLRDFID